MIRTLALIAAVSFVLCIGAIAASLAIAGGPFFVGEDFRVHHWSWSGGFNHHHARWASHDHGPQTARTFTWSGGDQLAVDLPADVTFTQGPTTTLIIHGSKDALDQVVVHGGQIDYRPGVYDGERLQIELTAPDVRRFELNGDQVLKLAGYKQDRLDLSINGAAKVSGAGSAAKVSLDISGSGDADLAALAVDDAAITISGSGSVALAAKGAVKVDVSGSGDVRLLNRPRSLETDISGSGHVTQPATL